MVTGIPANIVHHSPSQLSVESAGTESQVNRGDPGILNGHPVSVANGEQSQTAQANAANQKDGFASKLLSMGWSVITLPSTLFTAVTSALLSKFDSFLTAHFTPKESRAEYWDNMQ